MLLWGLLFPVILDGEIDKELLFFSVLIAILYALLDILDELKKANLP
jgi:hypothetical protein